MKEGRWGELSVHSYFWKSTSQHPPSAWVEAHPAKVLFQSGAHTQDFKEMLQGRGGERKGDKEAQWWVAHVLRRLGRTTISCAQPD